MPQGNRNKQLFKSAARLGEIIAGGSGGITFESEVIDALMDAPKANGEISESGKRACRASIASGFKTGKKHPRIPPTVTLEQTEPTAPAANFMTNEDARLELRKQLWYFIDPVGYLRAFPNAFLNYSGEIIGNYPPPATALRITGGLGKTSTAVRAMAWSDKTFVYMVPTLNLADTEIAKPLAALGVVPYVWRGMSADDPKNPGEKMCRNLPAVKVAVKMGAKVATSCCKYKDFKCPFFDQCEYQKQRAQFEKDKPRIVVCASDNLFHANEAIGTPPAVPPTRLLPEFATKNTARTFVQSMRWSKQSRRSAQKPSASNSRSCSSRMVSAPSTATATLAFGRSNSSQNLESVINRTPRQRAICIKTCCPF